MPNAVIPKNSDGVSKAPLTGDLQTGEIATNTLDGILYMKKSDGSIVELGGGSGYSLPVATATILGGIKQGASVTIDAQGVITVNDDGHNHVIGNIDGLQIALDGKSSTAHDHAGVYEPLIGYTPEDVANIRTSALGFQPVPDDTHYASEKLVKDSLDEKVNNSQVLTDVPISAVFTDTTYSVGNAGLTEINFTSALNTKLAGIEDSANNYSHPTTDGNKHVPANGTTNNGKVLTAGATAGVYTWEEASGGGGAETVYNLTGTVIAAANGRYQHKTLTANTTFTETLAEGEEVYLRLDDADLYTITFPSSFKFLYTLSQAQFPNLIEKEISMRLWKEGTEVFVEYIGSTAMGVTLVDSTSSYLSSNTDHVISLSELTLQEGDLVVVVFARSGVVDNVISGWSQVNRTTSEFDNYSGYAYSKVMGATPDTSFTVTAGTAHLWGRSVVGIYQYRNFDTTTPVEYFSHKTTDGTSDVSFEAITTPDLRTQYILFALTYVSSTNDAVPDIPPDQHDYYQYSLSATYSSNFGVCCGVIDDAGATLLQPTTITGMASITASSVGIIFKVNKYKG